MSQMDALLKNVKTNANNDLILTMDYNPSNPNTYEIIHEFWPHTDKSSATRLLCGANIVIGFRRPKNIQEIVCRTDIKSPEKFNNQKPRCNSMA